MLHNLLSALGAAILTLIVYIVIGFTAGGWAMLLVAIALMAAVGFLVSAAVAVPLTHVVLFRPRTAANSAQVTTATS